MAYQSITERWTARVGGLRLRAGLTLGSLLIMQLASGLVLLAQYNAMDELADQVVKSHSALNRIIAIQGRDNNITYGLFGYVDTATPALRVKYNQSGERLSRTAAEELKQLAPGHSALIDQIATSSSNLRAAETQVLSLYDSGDKAKAFAVLRSETYQSWENYFTASIDQFSNQESDRVVELQVSLNDASARVQLICWLLPTVVFLIFLIMAIVTFKILVHPLVRMEQAARALSEGNLDVRVPVTSRDEVGKLAIAFNKMAVVLKEESLHSSERLAKITKELGE